MKLSFEFLRRIKVRIALSFSLLFMIVAVPAIIYAFNQVNMFFEGMFLQQMRVASQSANALIGPQVSPDSLTRAISKITSTSAFLVAKNGEIISRSYEEPLPDSALLFPTVLETLSEQASDQVWHKFIKIENRRYLEVQTELADGQRLLLVKSFSRVTMLMARMREVIFWSSFLGLVALIAVAFWVSANITKQLEKLTEQAKKIRLGSLPEKTDIKSPDEVGDLADALNDIVDNLNRTKIDLLRLEATQKSFYSHLGQRLERPLIAIQEQLNCVIAAAGPISELSKKQLQEVHSQARRIQEIIRTLIEISQLEFGEVTLQPQPVGLRDLIESVSNEFNEQADCKGLRLETICEPDALIAMADEKWLKVALENLISNAIDFTEAGYVRIVCEISGSLAHIIIEDSGKGIAQGQIEKVFERFYSGESPEASGRAGLGLVLVKEIIRAHQQKLEVESKLGVGSRFSFYLPTMVS